MVKKVFLGLFLVLSGCMPTPAPAFTVQVPCVNRGNMIACEDGSFGVKVRRLPQGDVWKIFNGKGGSQYCGIRPNGSLSACTRLMPVDGYMEQ